MSQIENLQSKTESILHSHGENKGP